MDLLIDVNVALDVCGQRKPHAATSMLAIETAKARAARLWLYAGSTQTLEYNLYQHLKRIQQPSPHGPSNKSLLGKARRVLTEFVKDSSKGDTIGAGVLTMFSSKNQLASRHYF